MYTNYTSRSFSSKPRMFAKRILCNFQVVFLVGVSLGIQVLLLQYNDSGNYANKETLEKGDVLYYHNANLRVHYADFAKSVLYHIAVKPCDSQSQSTVHKCDVPGSSFEVHNAASLNIRTAGLYQTLGDSNVPAVSAFLDDRLGPDRKVLRILSVGLYPGPTSKLYCSYNCGGSEDEEKRCSSPVSGVVLSTEGQGGYSKADSSQASKSDVHSLACPVRPSDHPSFATITTRPCGYSHNILSVKALDTHNVVVPPRPIGICVRPVVNENSINATDFTTIFPVWLEYLRYLGADQVVLYLPKLSETSENIVEYYEKETFSLISRINWDVMHRNLNPLASSEAAVMDCIYANMMNFKHILVVDFLGFPIMQHPSTNLKQLTKSDWFLERVKEYGGFRIESGSDRTLRGPAFLLQSRLILATASQHFIALTKRPYFHSLEPRDVSIGGLEEVPGDLRIQLERHTRKKMERIMKS